MHAWVIVSIRFILLIYSNCIYAYYFKCSVLIINWYLPIYLLSLLILFVLNFILNGCNRDCLLGRVIWAQDGYFDFHFSLLFWSLYKSYSTRLNLSYI